MKSRLKVPSPAMIVACVALLVALGGTSYAAIALPNNSVGTKQIKANAVTSAKIKKHTIVTADLNAGTVTALKGAKGVTGATGATGPQGAAGTAVAFGDVPATVSGGVSVRHGWNGTIEHISTGVYCMSGFTGTLSNVVASVDATSPDLGATAQAMIGASLCPAGTQIEVQTYDGSAARANEPFDFVVN
jgi:hypothetical protein